MAKVRSAKMTYRTRADGSIRVDYTFRCEGCGYYCWGFRINPPAGWAPRFCRWACGGDKVGG